MNVLITGGTGSIGEEIVKIFSGNVAFNIDFTYHDNRSKALLIEDSFSNCHAITNGEIGNAYDVIVNNAGIINSLQPCEDITQDDWDNTLRINLTLPFQIIKRNLPYLKSRCWGRIINISSMYGVIADEDFLPYIVSKHGLIGLTRSISKEYGRYGITCNSVCPGVIESDLNKEIAHHYCKSEKEIEEYYSQLLQAVPARRLGKPHEIAELVFFLASDKAAYINGATLLIDGGYTS